MSTNMTFLKRIMHSLTTAMERSAQNRTRQYLLGLTDRHLEDMGLSRELIKQGPKAWPWRAPDESPIPLRLQALDTDSNAQPADHDRARRGIEHAVGLTHPGTDTKLAA